MVKTSRSRINSKGTRKPLTSRSKLMMRGRKTRKVQQPLGAPIGPRSGALQLVNSSASRSYGRIGMLPAMQECTAKYLVATTTPWSPEAMGACVPSSDARPSQKVTAFSRVTGVIGTQGIGYVVITPSLSNDAPCMYVTTAAFTGTNNLPLTVTAGIAALTAGWQMAYTNSPYPTSRFLPNVTNSGFYNNVLAGRMVSAGTSVEYTGTVMNMGGLLYCLTEPVHNNLMGVSIGGLAGYTDCDIKRVSDKKCWLVSFGQNDTECSYSSPATSSAAAFVAQNVSAAGVPMTNLIYPFSKGEQMIECLQGPTTYTDASGASDINFLAGMAAQTSVIGITGVPGNTFQVETVMHIEYVGALAQAFVTPSHRDPAGLAIVQQALSIAPAIKQSTGKDWASSVIDGVVSVTKEYGPAALRKGKDILVGLASSLLF